MEIPLCIKRKRLPNSLFLERLLWNTCEFFLCPVEMLYKSFKKLNQSFWSALQLGNVFLKDLGFIS